jgi:hypothetical protein
MIEADTDDKYMYIPEKTEVLVVSQLLQSVSGYELSNTVIKMMFPTLQAASVK